MHRSAGRALEGHGITPERLARELKAELNARSSQRTKLKGVVEPDTLPRGRKLVVTSVTADGKEGETVIEWTEPNWRIRQQARMDAQKLLDLYPAERHEHAGSVTLVSQAPEPKPLPDHFKVGADAENE